MNTAKPNQGSDAKRELDKNEKMVGGIFFLFVCGIVFSVNAATASIDTGEPPEATALQNVPTNVVVLSKSLDKLPEEVRSVKQRILLVGNSHTYGLPGLNKGDPLRKDSGKTLVFELARQSSDQLSPETTDFFRLSNPNILPFEVLTRLVYLLEKGIRPTSVLMGWCWPNFARDRDLRRTIQIAYQDEAFANSMLERLGDPEMKDFSEVLGAVKAEIRQAEFEREKERTKSNSDSLDEQITEWLRKTVPLFGQSGPLRARFYRATIKRFQGWVTRSSPAKNDQPWLKKTIESDLKFNVACMRTIMKILKKENIPALFYFTPERSDYALTRDIKERDRVLDALVSEARAMGFATANARNTVSNDYWGYAGDYPDFAHFIEPGHTALAAALIDAALRQNLWATAGNKANEIQ